MSDLPNKPNQPIKKIVSNIPIFIPERYITNKDKHFTKRIIYKKKIK